MLASQTRLCCISTKNAKHPVFSDFRCPTVRIFPTDIWRIPKQRSQLCKSIKQMWTGTIYSSFKGIRRPREISACPKTSLTEFALKKNIFALKKTIKLKQCIYNPGLCNVACLFILFSAIKLQGRPWLLNCYYIL